MKVELKKPKTTKKAAYSCYVSEGTVSTLVTVGVTVAASVVAAVITKG